MYVHSVKLVNFKSFGDYPENEVILEPRITAVIGKNESGKSNVLEGISQIELLSNQASAFADTVANRGCESGENIEYHIVLKPTQTDVKLGITKDAIIILKKNSFTASGGLLEYYNQVARDAADALLEVLHRNGSNPFKLRDKELTAYSTYVNELKRAEYLNIPQLLTAIDWLHRRSSQIPTELKDDFISAIEALEVKLRDFIAVLPTFFYRKSDRHLKTAYKSDEIEKELNTPSITTTDLLFNFVTLAKIPYDDFVLASKSGTTPRQATLRDRIKRLVETNINQKFQSFYKTEAITISLDFNAGTVSFLVQSNDGDTLMLSERSNGLRWYLETFIDAQAHNVSGRNVVYLLDEPGTSLHVNAQRELLQLFSHLADQGNQIVYTTHSPYMLDLAEEGVHRIRAVVKDDAGFSRVYKNAYDAKIAPESQQDTLAPIINALGMNLHDTFGPAKDKINVVTEGMSDYIYLSTMSKVLGVDAEKYAIIPSVGASNCVHICQILHGWGCKYLALFDYDKAGVESGGEYMRTEMLLEYGKQYCYVRDVLPGDIEKKTYKTQKYMIEDVMIQSEIERFCDESGTSKDLGKPLTAKLMCTAIENGSFSVSQQSKDNFQSLFARIFLNSAKLPSQEQ